MISNLLNISSVREETAVQFSILQNILLFSRLCLMPAHLKIICIVKSWNDTGVGKYKGVSFVFQSV